MKVDGGDRIAAPGPHTSDRTPRKHADRPLRAVPRGVASRPLAVPATTLQTWIGLLCLGACAAAPPFAPPAVAVEVAYAFAGADLGVPGETVDKPPQLDSKSVQIDVFALPTTPTFGSVELQLEAITADRGEPFRSASSLPPGTRWASPAPALDGAHRVGTGRAVTAAGLATTFALSAPGLPAFGCELAVPGVRLFLRPADGRERAILQAPLTEASDAVLFVPAADVRLAGHAVVIRLAGPADAAAVDAARREAEAAAQATPVPPADAQQWRVAAAAIGGQSRRAALLAIAVQLELPPCTDILLAAEEQQLIAIGDAVAQLDAAAAGYRWHFERTLWSALVPGLQRDELPLGLRAAVIRQLGAIAAEPSLLQLLLATSADGAAFADTLAEENLLALADRDPVGRVRACDWLGARGRTVPGYDPLAVPAARATALRAQADAEAKR